MTEDQHVGQPTMPWQVRLPSVAAQFATTLESLVPRGVVGGRRMGASANQSSGTQSNLDPGSFKALFQAAADREGLDENLVQAVAQAESGFRPDARSSAGAIGVMQLMPTTAKALGVDPYDPAANIAGGAKYLKAMLDRFGSIPLALAAYNAGPNAVEKYGGIPPYQETQTYVNRVMQLAQLSEHDKTGAGKEDEHGGQPIA